MNVALKNAATEGGFLFAPNPRTLTCPMRKANPDRYMFAQGATSLDGPVAAMAHGELKASRAFYTREAPGPPRNPQQDLMVPNQDDGLQFYFPDTGYDGALNEQAEVFGESVSPWMQLSRTRLLHGSRPTGSGPPPLTYDPFALLSPSTPTPAGGSGDDGGGPSTTPSTDRVRIRDSSPARRARRKGGGPSTTPAGMRSPGMGLNRDRRLNTHIRWDDWPNGMTVA